MILLFIPILTISYFSFNYFSKVIDIEIRNFSLNSIAKVRNVIDMQLQQLEKICVQMYSDEIFSSFYIKDNPINAMQAKKALYNYDVTNDFVHELFFYIRSDKLLYSSLSSYSISSFLKSYSYLHWDQTSFYNDINNCCKPLWRPSERVMTYNNIKPENFITYLYPLPTKNSKPYATVIMLIKEDTVKNLINYNLSNNSGNTIIMDTDGNIIVAYNKSDYLNSEEFRNSIAILDPQETYQIPINGVQYLCAYVQSDKTGWKYLNFIPLKEATKKSTNMKTIISLLTASVLALGGVIIYFLMYINYKPIKQLKEFAEASWEKMPYVRNELEVAKLAISNLLKNTNLLNEKVSSNRVAIREFLLQKIINGEINNVSELNNSGADVDVIFTKSCYRAAILLFDNTESLNTIKSKNFITQIEEFFPEEIECYCKNCFDKGRLVLLMCTENISDNMFEEYFLDLQRHLYDNYSLKVTIGIGNEYSEISQIGKSYIEASTAIDYRLVYGNYRVLFFSSSIKNSSTFDYFPSKLLETLELSILQGKTDEISDTISKIVTVIRENNTPLVIARCISFDIINTIIKTTSKLGRFFYTRGKYPDVLSLVRFQTVEELAEMVNIICEDICDFVQSSKEENDPNIIIDEIHQYIWDNYQNCDFSIQTMADHFETSPSNLSHFYKRHMSKNIIEFVVDLRIMKAKELLITSDYTINKIISDVGYYDASTFIKKFKKIVGVTPGEYRRLYKH
jgi:two-component system response regulator YesN